jgi:hypothetical protein
MISLMYSKELDSLLNIGKIKSNGMARKRKKNKK